jgi:hypothetical protein
MLRLNKSEQVYSISGAFRGTPWPIAFPLLLPTEEKE